MSKKIHYRNLHIDTAWVEKAGVCTACGLYENWSFFEHTRDARKVTCKACQRTQLFKKEFEGQAKRRIKNADKIKKSEAKTKKIEGYLKDKEYFKTPFAGLEL